MAPSKRLLPWSDDDDADAAAAAELSRPRKRWRSLVLELRGRRRTMEGVFGFREFMGEEFMAMFLPFFGKMVQRVVSEEVEKADFRRFSAPEHAPAPAPPRLLVSWNQQRPRYQLMFLNDLKPVYTMLKLEAKDGQALKVAIFERLENNQMDIVKFGHLSSAKVEVVVLHGNFNAKNEEHWTPEDFTKHIVCGREKSAELLTGNLTLKLNGGEASLESAIFTDNSSFTSTKKFRLGLRLVNDSGDRVLEGVTEPFRVKERRVEGFEKHYPPKLEDEVWRLEKIGRNGAYHKALSNSGINTVQKFLQDYVMNEKKLIQTFSKMSQAAWKAIISHAMTCEVSNNLCLYEVKGINIGLFFDAIYQLVGVRLGGSYKPIDDLSQTEKNEVDAMKQVAYENMSGVQYGYKMVNNYPVLFRSFHDEDTPVLTNFVPNQQLPNCGQYNSSQPEFSFGQAFESEENFSSFQGAPNVSRQRIKPSHIPNTEITYLSSDTTASAAHSNIQIDQFATQIDQYGHNKPSHSYEELYNTFSPGPFLLPSNSKYSEF
ncbi:hypothetical protein GUJ93_ZPchr0009g1082 [Zizania palustris]|uniref:Calmodulin-binding protein n=1 Tax=Zizania palustris TaxID=103762 RepID=A0A8J5V2N6_ZIZPA|nr:hypothetical protein GUJ93_ZPchr0009g1082 [Zizania palustris]